MAQRSIVPIAKNDVHRLTSGQVVLSLAGATKELVENSLDAGATNIDVFFEARGANVVSVVRPPGAVVPRRRAAS